MSLQLGGDCRSLIIFLRKEPFLSQRPGRDLLTLLPKSGNEAKGKVRKRNLQTKGYQPKQSREQPGTERKKLTKKLAAENGD